MPTEIDRILDEVLALPCNVRIELVDKILASMNPPAKPEIERLWAEEAERRVSELEKGEIAPIPGQEVFDRIRRKYTR